MDTAAEKVVAAAARAMRSVSSYRFSADEELTAGTTSSTRLVGAVVREAAITYRLTVGAHTTDVVRLRSATYVRVPPRGWSRLSRRGRVVDPTTGLTQILTALRPDAAAHLHGLTSVHGTLPAAAARRAGLPASRPADVLVTIDAHGHVIELDVRSTTRAAGRDVTVRLRTSYSGFGQVRSIRRPV